jgi:hypothetical protein
MSDFELGRMPVLSPLVLLGRYGTEPFVCIARRLVDLCLTRRVISRLWAMDQWGDRRRSDLRARSGFDTARRRRGNLNELVGLHEPRGVRASTRSDLRMGLALQRQFLVVRVCDRAPAVVVSE